MSKETIEKTLGIDLDTLFTLMSLNVPGTLGHTELRRDSESGRWWFSMTSVEEGHHYPLDEYGKTWALTKEELE